jgi:hypothetical protein
MSTELDLIHDGEIALTAPAPGTSAAAIDMLRGHAEMMDMAYELATKMVRTSMVPNIYRGKPEDATAAILYGAELGLNPIQSLQQVFAVHGQPAIYARTMVALLKTKGYRIWTVESSDESVTVTGISPDGIEEESTWTIERADQAGYVAKQDAQGEWIKNGNGKIAGNTKYITDPQAMLYAKAAAEVCRKLAPDVLLGISHSREDLESEPDPEPVRATARRLDVHPAVVGNTGPAAIRQWSAGRLPDEDQETAEPASNEGAKQDIAQADEGSTPVVSAEGTENPESNSEPVAGPSTRTQQRYISKQLEALGASDRAQKLAYLTTYFERGFDSVAELTRAEADDVIDEIDRQVAAKLQKEGSDTVAEATDTDGAEQAAGETEAAGR